MTESVWKIIARPDPSLPPLIETAPVLVVHMRAEGTVLYADADGGSLSCAATEAVAAEPTV